jgi:3-oxoacyl-[acyl-carrier protein] reductase
MSKHILITGATGGLGGKICETLAEEGNSLYLVSRNEQSLKELKSSLEKVSKAGILMVPCDVADYASLKSALKRVTKLDVLINCAGVLGPVGPFGENDISEWESAFRTNFFGTVYSCSLLIQKLKSSKRGKIMNFSGGGSVFPRKYHTSYASAKAAIVRFSENLSVDHPEIDVNSVAPGAHKTNIWKDETFDQEPERWADMSRLQSLVSFLCSSKSDGITGKLIHINDCWEKWDPKKLQPDFYTLRRIDERLLEKLR